MQSQQQQESYQALNDIRDIRGIMERSTRFLSLSGWSGIWAGSTALASAAVAWNIIQPYVAFRDARPAAFTHFTDLIILAVVTFIVAFIGAYYFTWRKASANGQKVWNRASRQLMWTIAVPIAVGGVFCLAFLEYGAYEFIVPACLSFYGLALISGSKYTLGEIRWLGYSELVLGCIALLIPDYGLVFMAAGFGILHILYGIVMWSKYDKPRSA